MNLHIQKTSRTSSERLMYTQFTSYTQGFVTETGTADTLLKLKI